MKAPLIAAVIVMVIVNGFMLYTFWTVTRVINKQIKSYFILQLDQYDELVEQKLEQMKRLKTETAQLLEYRQLLAEELPVSGSSADMADAEPQRRHMFVEVPAARYRSNTFAADYRTVRKGLQQLDYQKIVKDVIAQIDCLPEPDQVNPSSIGEKIGYEDCFAISMLQADSQLSMLRELFDEKEKQYLDQYLERMELEETEFDVVEFMAAVQQDASAFDRTIHIQTNGELRELSKLDSRIVVEEAQDICEGIRILYRDHMYDYSI